MVRILSPASALRDFVFSYWFVEDLGGIHRGREIRTIPHTATVLTVNLARPNADSNGDPVPVASILGVQSHSRSWYPGPETYFVMVMLRVRGLIFLFPDTGEVHVYGHVMHAFTFKGAHFPERGIMYNEAAAGRSWKAMRAFLSEKLDS